MRLFGSRQREGGSVGLGFIAGTQYQGSDERRNMIVPLLDYQWINGWFAGVTNGVGYDFAKRADMQYGLRLTADFGRAQSRSAVLHGMGNIDIKPQASAFFNYFPTQEVFLTSSLRYGSGNDAKGLLADLGAGYATQLAPQWRLTLGAAISLANAEYMQAYFGVTPAQAAKSGHAAYSAGAGARDARLNGSLTYILSQRLTFTTALSVSTLLGDAKDSPLTRRTSSPTGVFAIAYAF